ncbi:unnamed protein product [Adineta ricciae]|uniref:Reverse transcriptase domain-containing protein n=1 Tax=Adineta ricciae TaxID=249248 RepID=A0A814NYJ5_ADIRI|nr:unnamed protein product [Adineta ricciae]CAF1498462.1 unnamed protein product [Adineta ricciae]
MSTNNNQRQQRQQPQAPSQFYHRGGVPGATNDTYYYNSNYQRRRPQYYNRPYHPYDHNPYYSRYDYHYDYYNQGYFPRRRPPPPPPRSRSRQRSNGSRSRQQPQQTNRRNYPRLPQLGDFMSAELLDTPPVESGTNNLPNEFNLIPNNVLPQQPNSATQTIRPIATTDNTNNNNNNNNKYPNTQPFYIDQPRRQQQQQQQQQKQKTTTSTQRRRVRRIRQKQYNRNNNYDNNEEHIDYDKEEEEQEDDNNLVLNKKQINKKKNKQRFYLQSNRVFQYIKEHDPDALTGRSTQAYILATINSYDEWVRLNYELQIFEEYLRIGLNHQQWANEIAKRNKRNNILCERFARKKINQLKVKIDQTRAVISDYQIQLHTFWSQNPPKSTATSTTYDRKRVKEAVNRTEDILLKYILHCTQHVKKASLNRIKLAQIEMDEYKALKDFEKLATPAQWRLHLFIQPKMTLWSTKNQNLRIATKRVEYDLPPKFIGQTQLSFNFNDDQILPNEEAQQIYDQMRQITQEYHRQSMTLYVQTHTRKLELLTNEIKQMIQCFPEDNDDGFDAQAGFTAFKYYNDLREKRYNLLADQACHFLEILKVEGDNNQEMEVIAQTIGRSLPDEYHLLQLGPRFIYNDPQTAARRRTNELATLQRKIETRFYEKKVSPGRPVKDFISELDLLLQNLHESSAIPHHYQSHIICNKKIKKKKKINYHRLLKRLKFKFKLNSIILRKTDKSKVFHLGTSDEYDKKSMEYMNRTKAYQCLGSINNPLPDLITRTNKYLLDLRFIKWITQKQYEQLCLKQTDDIELAHLYYLPKSHKSGTPLRPIISGLKHPTIKISKYLDDLLRPLFNQMASTTTVTSGYELIQRLQIWSHTNLQRETILCTIDVIDLYTMIPQTEGVLALKKMLDYLKLKQVDGLKVETIIRLARFVIQNNYFEYNNNYYHQIRGGAMGSPLTLTIANCYMFFLEQKISRQINNSFGLYVRYIDDIFIIINWPLRHLVKQIDRWNKFDENIQLSANISHQVNFLDLFIENQDGQLFTKVYHKPSYEPYYLPFNSVHPIHMKKNIPFTMLLRAIRYSSTFQIYLNEREKLRMALLINKYPNTFIEKQFNKLFIKYKIQQPLTVDNYNICRDQIINSPIQIKAPVDYGHTMFVHFTYCSNMRSFPKKFHSLWQKYFEHSPINDINPVLGTRNANNLQLRLVRTRDT